MEEPFLDNYEQDSEEEKECRICRGPSEEGRELFTPCKCSGSIAYTHHDCLVGWLQFKNSKKCELCGHTFEFQPLYADDTPDRLPIAVMIFALIKHLVGLIPKALTFFLCIATWLVIVPLITAHIYYGWLNSPRGILDRQSHIPEDVIAGIVISVCIIISFLSIMSFVDFLRFHWVARQNGEERLHVNGAGGDDAAAANPFRGMPIERVNPILEEDDARPVMMDNDRQQAREDLRQLPPVPPQQQNGAQVQEEDIEIHLALNELLGLQSPLILLRNAVWYLCFVILYLGVVVYLPWRLGGLALKALPVQINFSPTKSLLTLPDLITLFAGYFVQVCLGAMTHLALVVVYKASKFVRSVKDGSITNHDRNDENGNELFVLVNSILHTSLKIICLLFLKMALLPLLIGVILDYSTLSLFTNIDLETRINDVINNVVVSIVLHWVLGITFMLVVTVSVLQMREVMHPNVLKDIIRPQEANVDLLGNLLSESNSTHVKRIGISLGIYISLLLVHIYIPIQILFYFGVQPAWEVHTFYLCGNLGRFIELLLFHLSMLSFIEKFKNQIGRAQHIFLCKFCSVTNLTRHLLPCRVLRFDYVGRKALFVKNEGGEDIFDPFWEMLADPDVSNNSKEELLEEALESADKTTTNIEDKISVEGFSWLGRKVLESKKSISIGSSSIPTVIGRYRVQIFKDDVLIYQEIPDVDKPIPRPPHNWDDLAGGGAESQGRWSWDNERASNIERSTARRDKFGAKEWPKLFLLGIFAWCATVTTIFCSFIIPLHLGRALFSLVNISPHDPFGFVVGASICGVIIYILHLVTTSGMDIKSWLGSFTLPPTGKLLVFAYSLTGWFLCIPMLLGGLYHCLFPLDVLASTSRVLFVARLWSIGSILLHSWSALCYIDFFREEFWYEMGFLNQRNRAHRGRNSWKDWQGRYGKISRFYVQVFTILSSWQWDQVNRLELADNFVTPVLKNVITTFLVAQSLSFHSLFMCRLCSLISVSLQLAFHHEEAVKAWCVKMHKIAKDDLYLIGEKLVNYKAVIR